MNILIIGFGTVGKHYFNILKNNRKVKNIYICDKQILPYNFKNYQIKFDIEAIKKKKLILQ